MKNFFGLKDFAFFLLISLLTFLYFLIPNFWSEEGPAEKESLSINREYFKEAQVINSGNRIQKLVALTFDADLSPDMLTALRSGKVESWYNKEAIKTLEREEVKATIFMTGMWAEEYSNEARSMARSKLFEIGNHSFSHPAFVKSCYGLPVVSKESLEGEIKYGESTIWKITGIKPRYFRFPGGCFDKNSLLAVSNNGLKTVQWDVISGDAFNQDTQSIVKNVEANVKNGSIVVMHLNKGPNASKTNDALLTIIPDLKKGGYKFVTISEMVKFDLIQSFQNLFPAYFTDKVKNYKPQNIYSKTSYL